MMDEELKLGSVLWPNFVSPLSISCYGRNEDCSVLAVGTNEGSIILFKIIDERKPDPNREKENETENDDETKNTRKNKNTKYSRHVEHNDKKRRHEKKDAMHTSVQENNKQNEEMKQNGFITSTSELVRLTQNEDSSENPGSCQASSFVNSQNDDFVNLPNNSCLNSDVIRNSNKNEKRKNGMIENKKHGLIGNDVNLLPYSVLLNSNDLCNNPVLQLNFGLSCASLVECISKEFLISLHGNNTICFWSLDEGRCFRTLKNFGFLIYNLRILPDRRYLLISGKRKVQLIDLWAKKNKEVIAYLSIEKGTDESNKEDRGMDMGVDKDRKVYRNRNHYRRTERSRIRTKLRKKIMRKEEKEYSTFNEEADGDDFETYQTYIVERTDMEYTPEDSEDKELYDRKKNIFTTTNRNGSINSKLNSTNTYSGNSRRSSIESITNITKEEKQVISIATGVVPYLKEKNQKSLIQCCKLLKRKLWNLCEKKGNVEDPLGDLLNNPINMESVDFVCENKDNKTNDENENELKEKFGGTLKEDEINKKFHNLFYSPVLVCALLNTGEVLCWDLTEFLDFHKSQCRFVMRTEKTESEMFHEIVQDIAENCAYYDIINRKMNLPNEEDTKVEEKKIIKKEIIFKKDGDIYIVEPITLAVFPQGDQILEIATAGNSNRINIIDNYIILLQKSRLIIFEKKKIENSSFFIPLMDIFCPDYVNETQYSKRRKKYKRTKQPHWVGIQVLRRPVWKFASGVFKNTYGKSKSFNILQKIAKNVYGCIVAWTTEGNFYCYTLPLKFSSFYLSFQLNIKSYFLGKIPKELLGSFKSPAPFIIYKDDILGGKVRGNEGEKVKTRGSKCRGDGTMCKKPSIPIVREKSVLKNSSDSGKRTSNKHMNIVVKSEKKKKKKRGKENVFPKYGKCRENLFFFFINEKHMNKIVTFENIRKCWFETTDIGKVWLLPRQHNSMKLEVRKKKNVSKREHEMRISRNYPRNGKITGIPNRTLCENENRCNTEPLVSFVKEKNMFDFVDGKRVVTYTVAEHYLNIYVIISYLDGIVTGVIVNSYKNKNRKKLIYDFPFPRENYWKKDLFIASLFCENNTIIGGSNKGDILMWKLPSCTLVKYLKKCHMTCVTSIHKVMNENFVLNRIQEIRDEKEKKNLKNKNTVNKREGYFYASDPTKCEEKGERSKNSCDYSYNHNENSDYDTYNMYNAEREWEQKVDPLSMEKEKSFILTTDSSNNFVLLNINQTYIGEKKNLFFCQNDECALAIGSDDVEFDTLFCSRRGEEEEEEEEEEEGEEEEQRHGTIVNFAKKGKRGGRWCREVDMKESEDITERETSSGVWERFRIKKKRKERKTREKNERLHKNKTHVCFHCSFKRLEKKNELTFKLIKKIYINTYTSLLYIMLLNNYVCIFNCDNGSFLRTAYDPEFINTTTDNSCFLFLSKLGISVGTINVLNKINWKSENGFCKGGLENIYETDTSEEKSNQSDKSDDIWKSAGVSLNSQIKEDFYDLSVMTNSLRNAKKNQRLVEIENEQMENWTSDISDKDYYNAHSSCSQKGCICDSLEFMKQPKCVCGSRRGPGFGSGPRFELGSIYRSEYEFESESFISSYNCSENGEQEERGREKRESEKIKEFYRKQMVKSKKCCFNTMKRYNKWVYVVKSQIPIISFLLFRDKNLSKKALPLTQFLYHFFISQTSINICKQLFPFLRSFPSLFFSLCVFGVDSSFSLIIPLNTQLCYFSKMISKTSQNEKARMHSEDCRRKRPYLSNWIYLNRLKCLRKRKKMKMERTHFYFVMDYLNLDNTWLQKNWRRKSSITEYARGKYYVLDLHLGSSRLRKNKQFRVNDYYGSIREKKEEEKGVKEKIQDVEKAEEDTETEKEKDHFNFPDNKDASTLERLCTDTFSLKNQKKKQYFDANRNLISNSFNMYRNEAKQDICENDKLRPIKKWTYNDSDIRKESSSILGDKEKKYYSNSCYSCEMNELYILKRESGTSYSPTCPSCWSDYSDKSSFCLYVKKEKTRRKRKKKKRMTKSLQFPIEELISVYCESAYVKTLYCCFMLRFLNLWCFNSRTKYKDTTLINFKKYIVNHLIENNEINLFLLSYISMYPYNKNIRVQLQHFLCRVLSKLNAKHMDKYAKTSAEVLRINNKKKRITEKSIDEICLYDMTCTRIISITIPQVGCLFLYPYIYADEICLTFLLLVLYARTEYLKKAKTLYSNTNMMSLLIHHICYYIFVGTEYFMDKANQYKKFKLFHFIHLLSLSYSITWDLSILTQKGIFTTNMKNQSSPALNLNLKSDDFLFNEDIVHRSFLKTLKNTLNSSEFEKYMKMSKQIEEKKKGKSFQDSSLDKHKIAQNNISPNWNNHKSVSGLLCDSTALSKSHDEERIVVSERTKSDEMLNQRTYATNTFVKNNNYVVQEEKIMFALDKWKINDVKKDSSKMYNNNINDTNMNDNNMNNNNNMNDNNINDNNINDNNINDNNSKYGELINPKRLKEVTQETINVGNDQKDIKKYAVKNTIDLNDATNSNTENENASTYKEYNRDKMYLSRRECSLDTQSNYSNKNEDYFVIRARKQIINEHNYLNICHFILNIFELYSISLNNVAFLKILINTGRIEPFLFL